MLKENTNITIREMTIADYEEVYAMWQITTKRALSKADEKPQIAAETSPTLPKSTEGMPSQGDPNEWFEYYRRFFGG